MTQIDHRAALIRNGLNPEMVEKMSDQQVLREYKKRDLKIVEALSNNNNWNKFDGIDLEKELTTHTENFQRFDIHQELDRPEVKAAAENLLLEKQAERRKENQAGLKAHKQKLEEYNKQQEELKVLKENLKNGGMSDEMLEDTLNKIKEIEFLPAPNPVFIPKPDLTVEDLADDEIVVEVIKNQAIDYYRKAETTFIELLESGEISEEEFNTALEQLKEKSLAKAYQISMLQIPNLIAAFQGENGVKNISVTTTIR